MFFFFFMVKIFCCRQFTMTFRIMVNVPTTMWYVVYCFYFWLHEWKPPTPPSIQSFSFISSSNWVHMVCLTTSIPWHAQPCLLCTSPGQWGPSISPASAAANAWLAAILRYFWKEAGIRVPRSPCVYTHASAGSNWVNEAESRAARECGSLPCILASHSIPTEMLPLSRSSIDLWTVGFFFSSVHLLMIKALTALTSGVCLHWILLRQAV